jgi:DNA-binding CsgD family transcriptional regulator/PAS domain-containing protein
VPIASSSWSAIEKARVALADAWLHRDGLALAARAMAEVVPGCFGMIYFREADGSFGEIGHDTTGRLESDWASCPVSDTLHRMMPYIAYRVRGPDRLAGRFAKLEEYTPDRRARAGYMRDVMRPNDLHDQARLVLYRRGKMRMWSGVLVPRGVRALDARGHSALQQLVPAARDAMKAAELTRFGRATSDTIQVLLDASDQPIWLLTTRGTVVFANATACELGADGARAARRAAGHPDDARFSISRLSIGGESLAMIVGRTSLPSRHLSPSLARVADRVAAGLSDKQIAGELDASLDTIRTYVQRIYRQLGVHNRVQLAATWRRR